MLARLLARRGEPGAAGEILSVALDEVANVEDSLVSGPLAVAQVELGSLDGSLGAMTDDARRALDLAAATGHRSVQAEMSAYLGRAGIEVPSPADPPGPWAPTLAGRWEEAAAAWAALGERYEEAVVLATAPHGQANARGLRILRELGAAATLMAV